MSETEIEPRPAAAASENSVDRAPCASAQADGEGILGEAPRNHDDSGGSPSEKKSVADRRDIFRALEVVERDSAAIAESYASLFSTLRLALSEVTRTSVENMHCFSDVVGSLQVSVLDAATKGNRYINSSLRSTLNATLYMIFICLRSENTFNSCERKMLRKNVDALDLAVNRLLRFP